MSEALDKVRGVRELPLFPLPVVLFPGMPMPLHIFEPRYRKMLADIRAGDNLFGLSYFDSAASENEIPAAGHIGCVAEVTETQALPDGRSNILTVGVVRYQVEAYVERGDPYLVVRPNFFEDDDEDDGGQRVEDVHEPHHETVGASAGVPGNGAPKHANGQADRRADDADEQRDLRAIENAREQIASMDVGAEPMPVVRRLKLVIGKFVGIITF